MGKSGGLKKTLSGGYSANFIGPFLKYDYSHIKGFGKIVILGGYRRIFNDDFLWQSLRKIGSTAFKIKHRNRQPDILMIWFINLRKTSVGHAD
jgi:hypothetical protein